MPYEPCLIVVIVAQSVGLIALAVRNARLARELRVARLRVTEAELKAVSAMYEQASKQLAEQVAFTAEVGNLIGGLGSAVEMLSADLERLRAGGAEAGQGASPEGSPSARPDVDTVIDGVAVTDEAIAAASATCNRDGNHNDGGEPWQN